MSESYSHWGMFPAVGPEPGDVVELVSGSLPMTVEGYCEGCGTVDVVWFSGTGDDGWVLMRDRLPAAALVLLNDDDEDTIGPCAGSC